MEIQKFLNGRVWQLTLTMIGLLIVTGCSDGIDRGSPESSESGNSSVSLDDDGPADISYVKLELLDHSSDQPAVISTLFSARDRDNKPADNLAIAHFEIREDNSLLPASESASSLLPREFQPYTMDTVILLDISSSISTADLANMKQSVVELVQEPSTGNSRLFSGQRVAIYTFDDSVQQIKSFSSSPQHIIQALETISLPVSITPTDLFGAVDFAANLWQSNFSMNTIQDGAVILITDGTDTAGRRTLSSTLKSIGDKKVFSVGVGDEINEEVLQDLGTAGYHQIRDFSELNHSLAGIREALRRYSDSYYYLQYASPKRAAEGKVSNSDHSFEIRMVENKNTGSSGKIGGKFNSYEFSNVQPRLLIGGPSVLESGQSATYLAKTQWSFQESVISWQISGDCSLNSNEGSKISLTATNSGGCQLSASDSANNNVLTNKSISISGD